MALFKWLFQRSRRRPEADRKTSEVPAFTDVDALVRAHGECLALLATVLERERIIASSDLARMLAEFASVTGTEGSAEAGILSLWASYLQESSASLTEASVLH